MPKRRHILLVGGVLFLVGLGWVLWGMSVGLQEINVSFNDRTETYEEPAIALVVIGILIMIASRFTRKDK